MLEEALQDPKIDPADVAQAMLSFVRSDLPSGGTSSEERFFKLFLLLCARVFGIKQDIKGNYIHDTGGWLAASNPWRSPPSGSSVQDQIYGRSRTVAGGRTTPSINSDPVVQLLGPVQKLPTTGDLNNENHLRSLIEAITVEADSRAGVRYPFPFPALPEPMQEQFFQVLGEAVVAAAAPNAHPMSINNNMNANAHNVNQNKPPVTASQNSRRLFANLLKVRPEGQTQVTAYQQRKLREKDQTQPLQLSPGLSSPQSLMPTSPPMTTPKPEQNEKVPSLFLSMLEYYMFHFIRYPLAAPCIPQQPQSQAGTMYRRQEAPYGKRIYYVLFNRYLRYFLPHKKSPYDEPEFSLSSEFFLRAVIAFWLESSGTVATTAWAVRSISERLQKSGVLQGPLIDLKMSHDLVFGKYEPPPTLAQKCLNSLVVHVITDPTLYSAVKDRDPCRLWCLSTAMTTLQQPFYNYLRTTFRYAPIHAQGSTFYTAMDAWLMWLEPWNVNHVDSAASKAQNATKRIISSVAGTSAHTSSSPLAIPSADRKSAYTRVWEPFLAANLFLYTVPLAIFLRRARELDFSPKYFHRSMTVLKRVFRVYTPEVISALSNLNQLVSNHGVGIGSTSLGKMVETHWGNLGDYAPSGNLSLSTCQADMQGLLEEIHTQHLKRVRDLGFLDNVAAFLEGLFGQGVVSGEKVVIDSLEERAKLIVGFPIDFDVFPSDQGRTGVPNQVEPNSALRTSQGILTDEGRRQLLSGQYKCSPTDVYYVGDRMQGRLRSHEIAFLVTLTTTLSTWLNKKLGLLPPPTSDSSMQITKLERFQENLKEQAGSKGWRINLRWLADYRNLVFTLCGIALLCKLASISYSYK